MIGPFFGLVYSSFTSGCYIQPQETPYDPSGPWLLNMMVFHLEIGFAYFRRFIAKT